MLEGGRHALDFRFCDPCVLSLPPPAADRRGNFRGDRLGLAVLDAKYSATANASTGEKGR
jgi:hypothetical protein